LCNFPLSSLFKGTQQTLKNHCPANLTPSPFIKHSMYCSARLQNLRDPCPFRADVHSLLLCVLAHPQCPSPPTARGRALSSRIPPPSLRCSTLFPVPAALLVSTAEPVSGRLSTTVPAWGHTSDRPHPSAPPRREEKGLEEAPSFAPARPCRRSRASPAPDSRLPRQGNAPTGSVL